MRMLSGNGLRKSEHFLIRHGKEQIWTNFKPEPWILTSDHFNNIHLSDGNSGVTNNTLSPLLRLASNCSQIHYLLGTSIFSFQIPGSVSKITDPFQSISCSSEFTVL